MDIERLKKNLVKFETTASEHRKQEATHREQAEAFEDAAEGVRLLLKQTNQES